MNAIQEWLRNGLGLIPRRGKKGGEIDYVSLDGTSAYEVSLGARGTRDVRDGLLRLSTFLRANKKVRRGYLLLSIERSTGPRTLEVWSQSIEVIIPDVARRIRMIAYVNGSIVVRPEEPEVKILAEKFRSILSANSTREFGGSHDVHDAPHGITPKSGPATTWRALEVEKYLFYLYLIDPRPVSVLEITKRVGCDYRTARQALRRLTARGLITHTRARKVEVKAIRREDWDELFVASRISYQPLEFVDTTGQAGVMERLLRCLRRLAKPNIALGGVEAARRWDPAFDLNGIPRIDLVFHAAGEMRTTPAIEEFIKQLDPALKPKEQGDKRSPILVAHPLRRRDSLFFHDPHQLVPWADPVETIIHLNDMGLTSQAGELVNRLLSLRGK